MSGVYPDSYEIEPWMPAISPGAPVPAPKYVPFNYSKMTPGNYFSHSIGANNTIFNGSLKNTPVQGDIVSDIYKKGLKVNTIGKGILPTAWNYKVTDKLLKNPELTMQKMGNVEGLSQTKPGSHRILGSGSIKPRRAAMGGGYNPPTTPRKMGGYNAHLDTVVMKGEPSMLNKPGPNFKQTQFTPNPDWGPEFQEGKGRIKPKTVIGHFPKGSNQMMTRPGNVTGRMPMIRGFGGSMIDMFNFGPLQNSEEKARGPRPEWL